jgi:hypothetical protein
MIGFGETLGAAIEFETSIFSGKRNMTLRAFENWPVIAACHFSLFLSLSLSQRSIFNSLNVRTLIIGALI